MAQKERRDFWKYQGALLSFAQVSALCDKLQSMRRSDIPFYGLMIALHVLYARPFRQSKPNRNLDEQLLPLEYSNLHRTLLQSRDKIFAHQDVKSGFVDERGEDLCKLRVHVREGGVDFSLSYVFPASARLEEVKNLCAQLMQECRSRSELIWKKAAGKHMVGHGTYEVDFSSESKEPLLRRSKGA